VGSVIQHKVNNVKDKAHFTRLWPKYGGFVVERVTTMIGNSASPGGSRRVVWDPGKQKYVSIDVTGSETWDLSNVDTDYDDCGGYFRTQIRRTLYRQPSMAWILLEQRIPWEVGGEPDWTYRQLTDLEAASTLLEDGIDPPTDVVHLVRDRLIGPDLPCASEPAATAANGVRQRSEFDTHAESSPLDPFSLAWPLKLKADLARRRVRRGTSVADLAHCGPAWGVLCLLARNYPNRTPPESLWQRDDNELGSVYTAVSNLRKLLAPLGVDIPHPGRVGYVLVETYPEP
jgi:hypothetical protein